MLLTETICAECGCELDTDYLAVHPAIQSNSGDYYCESCYNDTFVFCESCGEEVHKDDYIRSDDGDCYCQGCYDELFARCTHCQKEISRRDAITANDDDDTYCRYCFSELFDTCQNCDRDVSRDDAHYNDDGDCYCWRCWSELYTYCEDCGCEIPSGCARYVNNYTYCEECASSRSIEWDCGHFHPSQSYKVVGSRRKFGVELETSNCPDSRELKGNTCFGCKEDGSITGMEFVSPILSSDKGLEEIEKFCHKANRMGFEVDSHCGLHLHVDVSNLTPRQLKRVAYAYKLTEKLWQSFVPEARRRNNYCRSLPWSLHNVTRVVDQETWNFFVNSQDRYFWLNVTAHRKHGTFEIRLHTATLEAEKVINWVKAHVRFVDSVKDLTTGEIDRLFGDTLEEQFRGLSQCWDDSPLSDYYTARAERFGTYLRQPVCA